MWVFDSVSIVIFHGLLKSQWCFIFSALLFNYLANKMHLESSWMQPNKHGFIVVQEMIPKWESSIHAMSVQDVHTSSPRDYRETHKVSLYSLFHLQNMKIICSQVKCLWRMWFIALLMTCTEFEFGDLHLSMKLGRFMGLSTLQSPLTSSQ